MRKKLSKVMGLCVVGGMTLIPVIYAVAASQEVEAADQAKADAKAEEVEESGEAAGFKLAVKPEKKHYEGGDPIRLNVLCKSMTREKVEVSGRGIDLTYALEIVRPDGTPAPLTELGERILQGARLMNSWSGATLSPDNKHEFSMAA